MPSKSSHIYYTIKPKRIVLPKLPSVQVFSAPWVVGGLPILRSTGILYFIVFCVLYTYTLNGIALINVVSHFIQRYLGVIKINDGFKIIFLLCPIDRKITT
jgi:hypothetical protein